MGSLATQNVPALFKDSGAQLRPTDSLWEFGHSVINILSFIFSKKFQTPGPRLGGPGPERAQPQPRTSPLELGVGGGGVMGGPEACQPRAGRGRELG